MPTGDLIFPDGADVKSAMLYAIATLPEHRGHGIGASLTRFLAALGHGAGFHAVTLHPADEGLFGFYESRAGFRDFFVTREVTLRRGDLRGIGPGAGLSPISPAEYPEIRERFLQGRTHLSLNCDAAEYQRRLCSAYGGGFFALRGAFDGCAVVERGDGHVAVKELLLSDDTFAVKAAAAIAAAFPAEEYRVRLPAATRGGASGAETRFAMIVTDNGVLPPGGAGAWYGPAFD